MNYDVVIIDHKSKMTVKAGSQYDARLALHTLSCARHICLFVCCFFFQYITINYKIQQVGHKK